MIGVQKQVLRFEGEQSRVYHLPLFEKVDIQELIDTAYARGEKEITLPRGAYRIWPKEGKNGHIVFDGKQDFTVNAYGVIFLYQNVHKSGIRIQQSKNITIRGLTSDYEDTIFTQCRLIDKTKDYFDFEVDEGYAMYDEEDIKNKCQVTGRWYDDFTGELIPGTQARPICASDIELLGGRKFRLHNIPTPVEEHVKVGDYYCPMNTGMAPHGVALSIGDSGACTFEDMTFWSSSISCICECYTEGGSTYRGLKIIPGPKPLGATHRRLHSMSGDAFHLTANRHGPTIENTYFEGIQDDGINIHGIYSAVDTVLSSNKMIIANHGRFNYRAGDKLRLYNENLDLIQTVTVKSGRDITGEYKPEKPLCVKVAYATFHVYFYYEVELEEEILAERGSWLINANCIGSGFVFRNNTFYNITPRGVLIKSSEGLVENCFFNNCSNGGIKLITEFHWLEGDYSTNVTLRNNYIKHCGSSGNYDGFGIVFDGDEAIEHHNIVVEGNIFEDNYNEDLHISCAQDTIVRNNQFGQVHPIPRMDGFDLHPTVYVNKSKRTTFEGNTYAADRLKIVNGPESEGLIADTDVHSGSLSSDCIPGEQGRGGWHWQYVKIGTNEYHDYPNWIPGHVDKNGWWNGEFGDYTDGCVLRLWWDTYLSPGTESDVSRSYICPKDGILAITSTEPIKAGDVLDETDGVLVRILKNDTPVWPKDREWAEVPLFQQILRQIHTTEVKAGDVIHFRVNHNKTPEHNGTSWNPMVYYIDEK